MSRVTIGRMIHLIVAALLASTFGCASKQRRRPASPSAAGPRDGQPSTSPSSSGSDPAATEVSGGEEEAPRQESAPKPIGMVRDAEAMIRRGRYQQAINRCRDALRRNEKYVPAMVAMANAYFHLGKLEFAESVCDIALKIRSKTGACFALMGHISLKRKDDTRALKNFEKATQVDPGYPLGWLNYGGMLLRVKNYESAAKALSKAVELMPNRSEAQLNLGSAYRGAGKLAQARVAYMKALKIRPNYSSAYFNLGVLYLDATSVFDGKTRLAQLDQSVAHFQRYKQTASFAKHNQVDEYIQQAQRLRRREERKLKREARRKARKAAKAAREAEAKAKADAEAAAKAKADAEAGAKSETKGQQGAGEPSGQGADAEEKPAAAEGKPAAAKEQ